MLIVETGEGLSNSNSYASIEEFDAYCTLRNHMSAVAESETVKAGALVRATDYADWVYRFRSVKATDTQALEYPRLGEEGIASKLKTAVIELAILALKTDLMAPPERGILEKEVSVGPVTTKTTYDPAASTSEDRFPHITRLLKGVANRAGGSVQVGMMTQE